MLFHSSESVGTYPGFSNAIVVSQTRLEGNDPFETGFSSKHFALEITGKVSEGKYFSFSLPCSFILCSYAGSAILVDFKRSQLKWGFRHRISAIQTTA